MWRVNRLNLLLHGSKQRLMGKFLAFSFLFFFVKGLFWLALIAAAFLKFV